MWRGGEKCIQNFGGELDGKKSLEHLGVYMKIILEWILKE
jgi:hypothetical protein